MKTPNTGSAGSWARMAAVSALALSLAVLPSHPTFAQEPSGATAAAPTLSLEQAPARAARVDPALPGLDARARAGDAAVRQADVRPNPTLGLLVENLPSLGGGDILGRGSACGCNRPCPVIDPDRVVCGGVAIHPHAAARHQAASQGKPVP